MKFDIDTLLDSVEPESVDLAFFVTTDLPQKYTVACAVTGADNVLVSVPGICAAYRFDPERVLDFASDIHRIVLADGSEVEAMWIIDINEAFIEITGHPFRPHNIETLRQKPVIGFLH
ncbi:hypothetical protein JXVLWARM_CDS_0068 [Burkholderia phage Bm1]